MNIDHISPSILHVIAQENLNIQEDLAKEGTKTISQLINEETKTETKTEKDEIKS
jgi:hypothetical protein